MDFPTRKLLNEIARLKAQAIRQNQSVAQKYQKYRSDPVGYARDVLKVTWWPKQIEIAEALCKPPYRVLVKASHSVGKSHLGGGLVNWLYDTRNPGVVLTTAPTARQVRDILWKEVRRQRGDRGGFPGPTNPRLSDSAIHFAHGFTARNATSFQGQHEAGTFLVFDEAVDVRDEFWDAAETMCQGQDYCWLVMFNPTDTSSRAYREEQSPPGTWTVIDIPATAHPNITAELAGRPPPYPQAVRLQWLADKLAKWSERIPVDDRQDGDIEFPAGSGQWWRPGPLAESRLLARWPASGSGVWSDRLWSMAECAILDAPRTEYPEIGADIARFGSDMTEIHVRCGGVSLHHESHNGWSTDQTAGRLKQLCREWADWQTARLPRHSAPVDPLGIAVKIDDDGVGGGVVDQADGYQFLGLSAASRALDPEDYPNRRSELWFAVAERARRGQLCLACLPADVRAELKRQAMAPRWKVNGMGQRVVEPKDDTRETLGRSPDSIDSMNLAYAPVSEIGVASWL
jgi:hypothetical protein